jgi:hypothetical protein
MDLSKLKYLDSSAQHRVDEQNSARDKTVTLVAFRRGLQIRHSGT